jgi:hypothetical protein
MKTVADFKRAIQVGVMVHTIYHRENKRNESGQVIRLDDGYPEYTDKDMGVAPISIVQSTQFAVRRTRADGSVGDSWCAFPKASQSSFNGNSITISEDTGTPRGIYPILTYAIIS